MQSHIRKVYACLAVTCHLRFWQNDRGLLRATAVTRGWNGYRNKSQHRKLTLEKKILPQQRFEPATFRSRVRRSNHWAILAPGGIPGFYSTTGAVDYTAVIFCAHLVAVKCEIFTATSTREVQLCARPATQLTRSPHFRQISHSSPLHMRENLSERGLLHVCKNRYNSF